MKQTYQKVEAAFRNAPLQIHHGNRGQKKIPLRALLTGIVLSAILAAAPVTGATAVEQPPPNFKSFAADIAALASFADRSTDTTGNSAAAAYIRKQFEQLGAEVVEGHQFSVPVIKHGISRLTIPGSDMDLQIHPILLNAISPQTVQDGLEGPLVYVGKGELPQFNGKQIDGSVILMEIDSGKNWLHAASLGARAVIYIDGRQTTKALYEDKTELTPIHFPRFRISSAEVVGIFGDVSSAPEGTVAPHVRLESDISWKEAVAENIYCLIPGRDPELAEQLLIVEAFYDSKAVVPGLSPGADQAVGIATLLSFARHLISDPPGRSVLLVATGGNAQELAGMREMIWSIHSRSKDLRKLERELKAARKRSKKQVSLLTEAEDKGLAAVLNKTESEGDPPGALLLEAVDGRLKTEVDLLSRRLMRLRLKEKSPENQALIQELAARRVQLRRFGWQNSLEELTAVEKEEILQLISPAIKDHEKVIADTGRQLKLFKTAKKFRSLAKSLDIAAVVSLHLSSGGAGFGAFNHGWLHTLRPRVNRVPNYAVLAEVLVDGAAALATQQPGPLLYQDTLRPSRKRTWQSHFLDRPPLGGELSSLAGFIGFTFVTVDDARPRWGTPSDTVENVDLQYAFRQGTQVGYMLAHLTRAPRLHDNRFPRDGFTSVTGRARFLRSGELFPDQPAPGTVIMAFQGPGRFYAMVDSLGKFHLKGVATKKLMRDKVIIEGYKFDPATGEVVWAIDKPQTGKPAYRLKIQRKSVETDLVIFACKHSTIFNLLEPRGFRYMTKIQLIDGRREATPERYWWSRIDTRSSVLASLYLDPGTRWKMTLSDTVLQKKLILLNASEEHPQGIGYLVDDTPFLHRTDYQIARDMWSLLGPRIENLEKHGIYNERISRLQQEGTADLKAAATALAAKQYDRFARSASASWALAARVYNDVESTQKDVLFGVLFYIALFVPFAFCMERLLFAYADIHKRIIAFIAILLLLIAVIYRVHPAFQLAYSPTVVILAFFIMGLSLIVTLIIYFRFEEEMTKLQRRARHMKAADIGRWKAFVAAFLLGVSNLRRRRLRTALTCTTLIILTFTVMSFTAVKSMRHHTRLLFQDRAPYLGYVFKNTNWTDLPPESLDTLTHHFGKGSVAAPRVWLEDPDRTRALRIPVRMGEKTAEARGAVGLSAAESRVSGMDAVLSAGRWFRPDETDAVLLPEQMALELGIDPKLPEETFVLLWGMPFRVVGTFAGKALAQRADLDGEPLTPVTFPSEVTMEMTDAEMEALESGEDVKSFQSRYQHIAGDLTIIVPYQTLLSWGGRLKAVAVKPASGDHNKEQAEHLVDRFGLLLFSGEPDGVFVYYASDTMSYSGVPNVVIPLVISVFIVLNTMIGSVYERKKEIGIYTSVGLAPSHVSFLFIAEALAFAVLSVVLGYLLAQVTAGLFAKTPLWSGITVNYSSMAGVAAMVLVILVVLVSVIYPSRVAAAIAIPDVHRSWKLPEAEGNRLSITLPFLMNYREHLSIGGYLLEYFEGHKDISHGVFSAGDLDFRLGQCKVPPEKQHVTTAADIQKEQGFGEDQREEEFLQISVNVWLAPFDFGIMQKTLMAFCLSPGDPGSLEIRVRMERLAGEANAWRRINKEFLLRLRKQLLVWRSLDLDEKDRYERLMTAAAAEKGMPAAQQR